MCGASQGTLSTVRFSLRRSVPLPPSASEEIETTQREFRPASHSLASRLYSPIRMSFSL